MMDQYIKYFKTRGVIVFTIEGKTGVFATKIDGTRVHIVNPVSYVELFDALERFGRMT